jgi:hypothetical protein
MSACSYRGRRDHEPTPLAKATGIYCMRKAVVRVRQLTGNPFVERDVCEVHAEEMINSGHFTLGEKNRVND